MRKKKSFKPSKRIEQRYLSLLEKLLAPIKKQALKHANNLKKFQQVLRKAANSPLFKKKAEKIAKEIATMALEQDARNWRDAARKSSRGKEIKDNIEKGISGNVEKRMQELFEYNATLIKTLPLNISKDVIEHVNTNVWKGKRADVLAEEIKRYFPAHTSANAKLIARTEVAKFESALTQARAEDIGIQWYEWRTSEDIAVRSSHRLMDKVLVPFRYPPTPERLDVKKRYKKYPPPYHAGNIYNCRCYMAPLTDFNDVGWPHKVYNWKTKKIELMGLNKFKELNNYKN